MTRASSKTVAPWEQRGIRAVAFPQSDARVIPACERLYDLIVHGEITHPEDPALNAHVHAAVARHSRRGWRLEKPDRTTNIDAAVALAVAIDRHAYQPQQVELLGWILPAPASAAVRSPTAATADAADGQHAARSVPGWEWGQLRTAVRVHDRACVRCGSTDQVQVHHRVPLTEGGGNQLGNLELRCKTCHTSAPAPWRL
jgi:HNH endonuclease